MKKNQNNENSFSVLISYLFWPFFAFYFSIFNYNKYNSRNLVMLFCSFFGLTMHIYKGTDSNRLRDYLLDEHAFEINDINILINYLSENVFDKIDFIQPLLIFIVSRFTNDINILLAIMGLIFGFFYSRNIWTLIDYANGNKLRVEAFTYLWIFIFLVPFWFINGFRFYTSVHVFFYGFFMFLKNEKKGYYYIFITIFIHDTFVISVALFLLYLIIRNYFKINYLIYLVSTTGFFSLKNLVSNSIENLPGFMKNRESYVSEEYKESLIEMSENINWYANNKYLFVKIIVFFSYLFIFYKRFHIIKNNKILLSLFSFSLIFNSFANFVEEIPSMYRFYFIGFMGQMAFLTIFFQQYKFVRRPEWYKIISIAVAVAFIIVEFWNGLMYVTLGTVIGNPLTFYMFDYSTSFYTMIKSFLR